VVDGAPNVYERNLAYVHRALEAANVTLARDAPRITIKSPLACSEDRIQSLRSKIRPFRCAEKYGLHAVAVRPQTGTYKAE
jgi:hypothetical protein